MELQYYGANCIAITTKKSRVVIDDNMQSLGLKTVVKPGDIELITSTKLVEPNKSSKISITYPGEYEIADVSVVANAAQAHIDQKGTNNSVMFRVEVGGLSVLVLGHIFPSLDDTQLEKIGTVDVMIVPVGGNGYTLDGVGALEMIKKVEPKIVVPTHYQQAGVKYEVPQMALAESLKGLGMEPVEPLARLKLKDSELPEILKLVILQPSV